MMRALGLCLLLAIVLVSGVHFPTKFARNSMSTSSFTTHGGLDEKKCLDIIASPENFEKPKGLFTS